MKNTIKAENITNPNYPDITLWLLRFTNGKEIVYRGTWQALLRKYPNTTEV